MKTAFSSTLIAFVMVFLLALSASVDAQTAADSDIIQPTVWPVTFIETFDDPLGDWQSGWFYQNSNAQSYYVSTGNCDPNYRGNEDFGIWITDDRDCGSFVQQDPIRINFTNNFADTAKSFSIDYHACFLGVSFNVYDRDGVLAFSEPVAPVCLVYSSHTYPLTNGISAFEFLSSGGEGSIAIDNVSLVFEGSTPSCPQGNSTFDGTTGILHIPCVDVDNGTSQYEVDLLKRGGGFTFDLNSATPLP